MSEKFTPGPWFIHPESPLHCVNQKGTNRHVAMVSCYKIAPVDGVENIANAHLIAAAPETYEALDTLVAVVGLTAFKHESQRAVLQEAVDLAIAALKKARGES